MERPLIQQIQSFAIPDDLRKILLDLAGEAEKLSPSLSKRTAWRVGHALERIASEAADASLDVHWWEIYLYMLGKYAAEAGPTGQAVVDLARKAVSPLRSHFGPYQPVTLRLIDADTVRGVCLLSDTLEEPQNSMVAPNAISLAQAHFNPHAWFRAIYAGKAPVGFVMIVDDDQTPEYFLWRFMIATPFQRRDYGRQAIEPLVDYVRTRPNARELGVSCGEGPGSPRGFYEKIGFISTGEVIDDELVLKLAL
jgi:diamine N-acetyltransferase